jgi:hypothetical protein
MSEGLDHTKLPTPDPSFAGSPGKTTGDSEPALPTGLGAVAAVTDQLPGSGDYRERCLGVKIPPANIQDYHLEAARKFADGLASR